MAKTPENKGSFPSLVILDIIRLMFGEQTTKNCTERNKNDHTAD